MNFNFVGELIFPKDKSPLRSGTGKGGKEWLSFNCSIAASKNNRAFIEMLDSEHDEVKYKNDDGDDVEIDWSDRLDEDIIKSVPNKYKYTVSLGKNSRKEFITRYDMIQFIMDNLDEFTGKKVMVTGVTKKNIYNGKMSDRFQIRNIYVVEDDFKADVPFKVTTKYFWNKDCIDVSEWKESKKLIINGYIYDYIDKETGSKYCPLQVTLNCGKIKFDEPDSIGFKKMKFLLKNVGVDYNDGKLKSALKKELKDGYVANELVLYYVRGAEEVEFSIDMLTDEQREAVELGISSIDDFKGRVYGDQVIEFKVIKPTLKGDFKSGLTETGFKASEFEEDIYVPSVKEESMDKYEKETEVDDEPEEDDDDMDLFG